MIYGSVCSGIEAASVAFGPLGWKPAFFSEIDAFPRAVLKHHYPDIPLYGDFRKIEAGSHAIDLLIGGTPCQSFSIAGLRQGLDCATGNLALEYIKLAARLRPRWLVWENVPGLLSIDGGRAFGTFVGGLVECGYSCAWRILDAQFAGVPQRRRRIFIIGHLGTDWRPSAAVLFEWESLSGNHPSRRKAGEDVTGTLGARTKAGGGFGGDFECSGGVQVDLELCSTIGSGRGFDRAGNTRGQDDVVACYVGNNSSDSIEVATACRAKGGTGHGDFESETFVTHTLGTQCGGVKEDSTGRGSPLVITHALRADGFDASEDGTGRGTPIIACNNTGQGGGSSRSYVAFAENQRGELKTSDAIGLTSGGGKPGQGYPAIAFQSSQSGMRLNGDTHATLDANNGSRRHHGVITSGVRRLCPVECEKLQGLPPGYTDVPYRGKKACDGPRYKAIGNSFAVPVVRWIGDRIQMVDDILKEL